MKLTAKQNAAQTIMAGEATRLTMQTMMDLRTKHSNNPRAVDQLAKVITSLRTVLTLPRQTYFGGREYEQLDMDPSKMGNVANLRPVRTLLVQRTDALGGQTASDTTLDAVAHRPYFTREEDGVEDVYAAASSTPPPPASPEEAAAMNVDED